MCRRRHDDIITRTTTTALLMSKQSKRTETSADVAALLEAEETPAGIAGSEVFGGNRQKEELYDADAEAKADTIIAGSKEIYSRFADSQALSDEQARHVAELLQNQINNVLYDESNQVQSTTYDENLVWETHFAIDKTSKTPLEELNKALNFYNRFDVAIVSAKTKSPFTVEAKWEISLAWPNFWEARALVTGSSMLTLKHDKIVKQSDTLDQGTDVLGTVGRQVIPRFWDTYHIGMTASAEIMPQLPCSSSAKKGLLSSYELCEIPPRLVLCPSIFDIGSREDAYAQVIPNHTFSTVIKTMGPKRQRYIATNPVEVRISHCASSQMPRISWTILVAVELLSNAQLPLPGKDPETLEEAKEECRYVYQSRRRVATLPFGGNPQDAEVTLSKMLRSSCLTPKVLKLGRETPMRMDFTRLFTSTRAGPRITQLRFPDRFKWCA